MNFALLWIDALLIALLWTAAVVACVSRIRRRWVRILLSAIGGLVPLAPLALFVAATAMMKFSMSIELNWFGYAVSLLLAFIIGASLILRQAARHKSGMPPAAAAWRRGPLAFAWLTAVAVGYMTLLNMDLAVRARCAILSVEINSVYLATLPAITSENQNAAPMYEKAFAQLRNSQAEERQVQNAPTGVRDYFDPNEPATIAFLKDQAATIALLRQAAALPACRFDSDLMTPDVAAMISILPEERNAPEVLMLDAREELARGRVSSAIDDAAAIFGMSRHFGQRPLVVSALVGIGIDFQGEETMEEVLPAVKTRGELAGLRLEQLPPLGRIFQQALRGEESFGVTLYGNMPSSKTASAEETLKLLHSNEGPASHTAPADGNAGQVQAAIFPSFGGGVQGAFVRAFMLNLDDYITLMTKLQDSATQPYYLVRSHVSQMFVLDRRRDLLLSIVGPSLSRVFRDVAEGEASDACTQTAVAMTLYRLDHGNLPAHLDDLVPAYLDAVPTDPFDGHPLRLVMKNGQRIIYSVGPDGIDDGGTKMIHFKGDIIFTLNP